MWFKRSSRSIGSVCHRRESRFEHRTGPSRSVIEGSLRLRFTNDIAEERLSCSLEANSHGGMVIHDTWLKLVQVNIHYSESCPSCPEMEARVSEDLGAASRSLLHEEALQRSKSIDGIQTE